MYRYGGRKECTGCPQTIADAVTTRNTPITSALSDLAADHINELAADINVEELSYRLRSGLLATIFYTVRA